MSPVILNSPSAVMDRPGVGLVISSGEAEVYAGRHVAAYLGRSRMGPINRAMRCTSLAQIQRIFGGAPFGGAPAGDATQANTMDGAMEALRGGASAVWVCRMGAVGTGTASSVTIGSVTFSSVGPGSDGDRLAISVLGDPGDASRQVVIYQRASISAPWTTAVQVGSIPFAGDDPGADPAVEQANLMTAYRELGSDFIVVVEAATPAVALPATAHAPLVGGTNPTINNAAINAGLDALGGAAWEVIAPDFLGESDIALLRAKLEEWLMGGKLVMTTVGTPPGQAWSLKESRAEQYNDPTLVLIGNGFRATGHALGSGQEVIGYLTAGREAGRHAGLPLARQLTHAPVRDAYATIDEPPPGEIAEANRTGVYTYTTNERGGVWTEWGLTTFSTTLRPPIWAVSADIGWRKSRLVLTRFRLLTDIAMALTPLIETASNNAAGRASVIAQAQRVIDDTYIPLGAVESGTVIQHPDYPPTADTFWMLISPLVTPDGIEKLIVEARFRRT